MLFFQISLFSLSKFLFVVTTLYFLFHTFSGNVPLHLNFQLRNCFDMFNPDCLPIFIMITTGEWRRHLPATLRWVSKLMVCHLIIKYYWTIPQEYSISLLFSFSKPLVHLDQNLEQWYHLKPKKECKLLINNLSLNIIVVNTQQNLWQ